MPRQREMLPPDALRDRIAEEVDRAERYGRPLAILAVALAGAGGDRDEAGRTVIRSLRSVDLAGWDDRGIVVVLPETDETSSVPAHRVAHALGAVAADARIGFAAWPRDGADAAALIDGAFAATRRAEPGGVAPAEPSSSVLDVDGRRIVAADPAFRKVLALVERLAPADLPVLVTGETGTGKEIVATALHAWSRRRGKLVAINCAALPDTLLESELFGYERGAFSGADAAKPGLFETAAGGTIFLDEIGEAAPRAQAKLLRVLETKRVARIGGTAERPIDVRVVAATNRTLVEEIREARFRQDLFFRLGAATVDVPPMRERPRDVEALARVFLDDACARLLRRSLAIADDARRRLAAHRWPGNVRELRNAMEFVAATAPGDVVSATDLPASVTGGTAPLAAVSRPKPTSFRNLNEEVRELERTRMREALEATGGARAKAAALIGMPLRTFVTKLKLFGLGGDAASSEAAS